MADQQRDKTGERPRRSLGARILRKLVKIFAWIMGVLLALILLAWLVLLIFFPDEKIKRMLVAEIEETLKVPVQAGDLDLEILSGLSLQDVTLGPPRGFDRPPLKVKRLLVDYSLADIFRKQITVRRVLIDQPEIVFESTGAGSNLAALLAGRPPEKPPAAKPVPKEEQGGFILDLERLEVKDARISARAGAAHAEIAHLNLIVSGRLGAPGQTNIQVSGRLAPPERPNLWFSPPGSKGAGGISTSAGISFKAGMDGQLRMTCEGELVLFGLSVTGSASRLKARFAGSADLGAGTAVLKTMEIEQDGQSVLSASGDVSDLFSNPSVHLNARHLQVPKAALASLLGKFAPGVQIEVGRAIRLENLNLEGSLKGELPRARATLRLDEVGLHIGDLRLERVSGTTKLDFTPGGSGGVMILDSKLALKRGRLGNIGVKQIDLSAQGRLALERDNGSWLIRSPELEFKSSLDDFRIGRIQAARISLGGKLKGSPEPSSLERGIVQIPRLDLNLNVNAQGLWLGAVGPGQRLRTLEALVTVSAGQLIFAEANNRPIGKLNGKLELKTSDLSFGGATVSRPRVRVSFRGESLSFSRRFGRPLKVQAKINTGPVTFEQAGLKSSVVLLSSRLTGPKVGTLPVDLNLTAEGIRRGDLRIPGALSLELSSLVGLRSADLDLKKCVASVSDLVRLQLGGELNWRTLATRAEIDLGPMEIERVLAMVPGDLRGQLPAITGRLQLSGGLSGTLPRGRIEFENLPFNVNAKLQIKGASFSKAGSPMKMNGLSGQLNLANNHEGKKLLRAGIQLSAGSLQIGDGIAAKGVNILATATRDGSQQTLSGHAGFSQLLVGQLHDKPISKVKIGFDAQLLGKKELRLKKLDLWLPAMGLKLGFNGRLMRAPESWDLSDWRMECRLSIGLRSSTPVELPGKLRSVGQAGLILSVDSIAAGVYSTRGKLSFSGLTVSGEGFGLENMHGTLPVSQLVAIKPVPGLLARRTRKIRQEGPSGKKSKAYDEALLPMKGSQRSFAIERGSFKDLKFTNIAGNLELADGRLNLGSLRLGFLDGDVLADAQVTFAPPGTRRLNLSAEMSGVDLSGLGALALAGSSDISGNLNLGIDMSGKAVSASVNLTQIGRSTLKALLVSMDPEEANPGVMELRGYLDRYQVSPKRVSLNIRHGLLGMEVVLKMGLTAKAAAKLISGFSGNTFRLKHLPIGGLLSKYLGF